MREETHVALGPIAETNRLELTKMRGMVRGTRAACAHALYKKYQEIKSTSGRNNYARSVCTRAYACSDVC